MKKYLLLLLLATIAFYSNGQSNMIQLKKVNYQKDLKSVVTKVQEKDCGYGDGRMCNKITHKSLIDNTKKDFFDSMDNGYFPNVQIGDTLYYHKRFLRGNIIYWLNNAE